MKKITLLNNDFYYSVDTHGDLEWGPSTFTNFYIKKRVDELKWSWPKFKKIPTGNKVDAYDRVFYLSGNMNTRYDLSKEQLKKELEEMADIYINKRNRQQELKNGEII